MLTLHLLWGAQTCPNLACVPLPKVCYPSCPTYVSREIHWGLPATGNLDGQVLGEEVSHWVRREGEPGVLFPPFVGTRTLACKLSYLADWFKLYQALPSPKLSKCGPSSLGAQLVSQQTAVAYLLSSPRERVWDLIRTPEMDSGFWNAALGI